MGWMTRVQFPIRAMKGFSPLATVSILALRSVQPPLRWVLGSFSAGCQAAGADQLAPSSVEVNVWSYIFTHPYDFMA